MYKYALFSDTFLITIRTGKLKMQIIIKFNKVCFQCLITVHYYRLAYSSLESDCSLKKINNRFAILI